MDTDASDQPAPLATCSCGHTRKHPMVTANAEYGGCVFLIGLFMGLNVGRPHRITFSCITCKEIVEVNTDPEMLRTYREH